jgi:hypothetical protein
MIGLTPKEVSNLLQYKDGKLFWVKAPSKRIAAGSQAGTLRPTGYRQIKILGKNYLEHHLVWYLHTGLWPTSDIDHVNRKRDDNRIENLREVSRQFNSFNNAAKGFCFDKHKKKYSAYIRIDGKLKNLGRYDTAEKAKNAYEKEKEKWFAENKNKL